MKKKIYIFGASGSGVSTLGRFLARELDVSFYDADDYYWKQTDPPFMEARPVAERKRLLEEVVSEDSSWVLSGSIISWGDAIQDKFDLAVYLYAPSELRLKRIKSRELARFGTRIEVGGDMHVGHLKFLDWVAQYDEGLMGGRSKKRHEAWIETFSCPVMRLDGSEKVEELALKILTYMDKI